MSEQADMSFNASRSFSDLERVKGKTYAFRTPLARNHRRPLSVQKALEIQRLEKAKHRKRLHPVLYRALNPPVSFEAHLKNNLALLDG
jgi:hypothetical protein